MKRMNNFYCEVISSVFVFGVRIAIPSDFGIKPYIRYMSMTNAVIQWTSPLNEVFCFRYAGADKVWNTTNVIACEKLTEMTGSVAIVENRVSDIACGAGIITQYIYAVNISGLVHDTEYRYEVLSKKLDVISGVFNTPSITAQNFTFIAYGDSRTGIKVHRNLARHFMSHKPVFILHTGDMVSYGAFLRWKNECFDVLADTIKEVPLLSTRGNHDGYYSHFWGSASNVSWYSYDYSFLHIVSLDSMKGNSEAMLNWFEKDISSCTSRWKIVFYHFPSFDMSRLTMRWGKDNWLPLFRKYGVDIVFSGHRHSYQRFRPVYTPGENEKHPITYIVTAGGGAELHSVGHDQSLLAFASEHHYIVFDMTKDELTCRVLNIDGQLLDKFCIRKRNESFDAHYISESFDETQFGVLRNMVSPSLKNLILEGDVTSQEGGIVSIQIQPIGKKWRFRFVLERNSAKHYIMPQVSGIADADKITEVQLHLRLAQTDKSDTLLKLPPLRLECFYEIDGVKGSAFGFVHTDVERTEE